MDSGAWGVHEVGSSIATTTPWANGTNAQLTFTSDNGTVLSDAFVVGVSPGGSGVNVPDPSSAIATSALNTGPLPLFHFSVAYDSVSGTIGLKVLQQSEPPVSLRHGDVQCQKPSFTAPPRQSSPQQSLAAPVPGRTAPAIPALPRPR